MTGEQSLILIGQRAREASRHIARASTDIKNKALALIAKNLREHSTAILERNHTDLENARRAGLAPALIDRLTLTEKGVAAMIEGVEQIIRLPDPIGEITDLKYRPSGIQVGKMRVPLGVIGIIYEARPNVTVDAAALSLKSGNATILRGGSDAICCNLFIAKLIQQSLVEAGLPEEIVQMVDTTDRAAVGKLITMREFIDVIVPRGGKELISRLLAECRIPMIQHLDGNCHVYVDETADLEKARLILENAKTQRYGTCNTAETLLIARPVAKHMLPILSHTLLEKGIEIRGCKESLALIPKAKAASEEDYFTEFLGPIIAVKIVADLDEAIKHINHYGSHHTDAIVTENYTHSLRFLREVDSASVIVNASTRFADGFEYGLGAEIGISTDKIHARGPVGLDGLTSQKWIVLGTGQVRT